MLLLDTALHTLSKLIIVSYIDFLLLFYLLLDEEIKLSIIRYRTMGNVSVCMEMMGLLVCQS